MSGKVEGVAASDSMMTSLLVKYAESDSSGCE